MSVFLLLALAAIGAAALLDPVLPDWVRPRMAVLAVLAGLTVVGLLLLAGAV